LPPDTGRAADIVRRRDVAMTRKMQTPAEPARAATIVRYLGGVGVALWALVMALRPDPGFVAPWPWTALFWAVQIASGLTVLQSVLYLMNRADGSGRAPLWLLVVGSGVVGSALLAPWYWLVGEGVMTGLLGFAETIDGDDDPGLPTDFGFMALAQEFGQIVGPVTAAWILISWPRLCGLLPPTLVVSEASPAGLPPPSPPAADPRPAWRAALPRELGDELIAVASELQYLRVWTSRGSALVLGSLQDVEDGEGGAGMRVHRSWWVSARHVRAVRRQGDGAVCALSDGREVPVSRRRKADVLARFGDNARYDVATGGPDQNIRRRPS
jgi:hypothetical protein